MNTFIVMVCIILLMAAVGNDYLIAAMALGLVIYWRAQYMTRDDISTFYVLLFVGLGLASVIVYTVGFFR